MSDLIPRKILVTGGAGFLGSHLIDRLIERGDSIVCLDNLYTGSKKNISKYLNNPKFEFILHDIVNPINLDIEEIYNLACPASPPHYQFDPVHTSKTSIFGAINMLELAREKNIKIFQASTSEVYGDPEMHPQHEDYWGHVNPIGLRSCYDEGKRCAETLFFDYKRQYDVKIKVARIFNTYGPRMDPNDGRVVSNIIMQALKNEPITLYGDGSQTRSFCYVDDLIEAFLRIMDKDENFTGPINIGNPNEFSINELAEKIINLTNSKSEITFQNLPSDDPKQRNPNIELAKKEINWEPKIQLEDGLKKTISFFENSIREGI
jgi:UDP-glucuronate decarboxylase